MSTPLQRDELRQADCTHICAEEVSAGRPFLRLELERMLDSLRPDDVVVVTRLDRPARHSSDLLRLDERIRAVGDAMRSLAEPWADTISPAGITGNGSLGSGLWSLRCSEAVAPA